MSNALLSDLIRSCQQQNLHVRNVAVAQNGVEIARHLFQPDVPIALWSVSKSITSLAIGIAEGRGELCLDDSLARYLDGDYAVYLPLAEPITVRNLLCLASGHETCPIFRAMDAGKPVEDIVRLFFEEPFVYPPGQRFVYDNSAVYMLSFLLSRATGLSLGEYCQRHLFAPLGIAGMHWDADEKGISLGFSGLHLRVGDLIKIGCLLLARGKWEGRAIVPASNVAEATQAQTSTAHYNPPFATPDHHQGYGYLFWQNSYPGSYRMDGMYGQYVVMLPDKNAVVAYLSEEPEKMTAILELTWNTLVDKL